MMRVLHVVSSLARGGGGPSRSVQGLVAGLSSAGVETWLLTLFPSEQPWIKGVDHFVNAEPFANVVSRIKPDIVHLHGLWNIRLHRSAKLCRSLQIPYVISPRGMLEPWSLKQKWLKKRIARFLYQDRDLANAAALHATAESEAEQICKLGFTNKIVLSPNGVNVPDSLPSPSPFTSKRALFVSRMHPKKGVLELVESWARIKPTGWQCELVYTLNREEEKAYESRVKKRIVDLGLSYSEGNDSTLIPHAVPAVDSPDFILTGPLSDDAKWDAYCRSNLFLLPTYSENFGIVVAEALWANLPVITTKGTPWQEVELDRCGWWIDLPVGNGCLFWRALDEVLRTAFSMSPESLAQLGRNGHALVCRKYTWSATIGAMKQGYDQILSMGANAPFDSHQNYAKAPQIH